MSIVEEGRGDFDLEHPLPIIRPSRHCESDRFSDMASRVVDGTDLSPPDWRTAVALERSASAEDRTLHQ